MNSGVGSGAPKRAGRRYAVALSLVSLAAVAGAGMLWGRGSAAEVESVAVARTTIESSVTALGVLQPRHYVDVGAQVSGQILKLRAQPGDIVAKGQLLVEIDPSVQQATVDAGRASLAGQRAQLADQQAQHRLAQQQQARQLPTVRRAKKTCRVRRPRWLPPPRECAISKPRSRRPRPR
jgi:membrane fusion protein, macrolide-specific efflux system